MPASTKPGTKPGKKPQDRLSKAPDAALYEFQWEGGTFSLPPADSAVDRISGRQLRDAYMDGDEGQMRLGFAMLDSIDAPEAIAALYSMPAPTMLDHLAGWMETRTRPDGATVGESLRSPS
jgi:hypothetical protein